MTNATLSNEKAVMHGILDQTESIPASQVYTAKSSKRRLTILVMLCISVITIVTSMHILILLQYKHGLVV